MKPIEERLWDFIDGTCSAEEKKAIERLLQTDSA
ncbi:MAG: zf-HC2 domain-containing protein, partial [Chitinophagales bacterium]